MEIVILLIISTLLVIIAFLALRRLTNSLEVSSKEYYLNKIKEYDEKIDEVIPKATDVIENDKTIIQDKKGIEETMLDASLLKIFNITDYSDVTYLRMNQHIDDLFNINEEQLIKKFVDDIMKNEMENVYQSIVDRFSPNFLYRLNTVSQEKQLEMLSKKFNEDEKKVLDNYLKNNKFNIKKFVIYVNECLDKSKNVIEVLVGDKNKNFNYISPYIKTIYSSDIFKGVIIKYQNKLFDYSINERDVVWW